MLVRVMDDFETEAERRIREALALLPGERFVRDADALHHRWEQLAAAERRIQFERDRVRTCPACGEVFQARSTLAIYCSRRCLKRMHRQRQQLKVYRFACQACGQVFSARRSDARFCSATCRSSSWRRDQR